MVRGNNKPFNPLKNYYKFNKEIKLLFLVDHIIIMVKSEEGYSLLIKHIKQVELNKPVKLTKQA